MSKTAVVVGGTSGIGRRIVERLVSEGWTAWSLGRRLASHGTSRNDSFHYQSCDVRDQASVARAFARVQETTPQVNALIYSAGVNIAGELHLIDPDDAELMFDVNLKGPWLSIREAYPLLREAARAHDPARVVIVGSIGGIRPKICGGIYGATKSGAHVLARVAAVELGPENITVNVVAPGSTDTPMYAATAEAEAKTGYRSSGPSPLGRIATVDDVVDVILFVLSPSAKYVNGVVLPVDGGTRAAYVNDKLPGLSSIPQPSEDTR